MLDPLPGTGALRPLGVGEILDRAVNATVRNFVVLAAIYVIFVVPLSIVQFFGSQNLSVLVQTFVDASKSGHTVDNADLVRQLSAHPTSPWVVVTYLALAVLSPLPFAAMIEATSALYLGRPTSFGAAYRVALGRYWQLVGVALLYLVAGGFAYFVAVLGIVAVFLAIGILYAFAAVPGTIVGVIVGAVVFAVLVAALIFVTLAFQISFFTCVIERQNFAVSFTRGFSRIGSRAGFRRALFVGLAYGAIVLGITLVAGLGELVIVGLLHSQAVGVAYSSIVRIVSAAFGTMVVTIFYFDLRVREEGLDLQMAAAAELGT